MGMNVEAAAPLLWSIAGAVFLLAVRHAARPEAEECDIVPDRRDWTTASFGLDLTVGALISSPILLVSRASMSDRLDEVREMLPDDAEAASSALNSFFGVVSYSSAANKVLLVLAGAVIGVAAYLVLVRNTGYERRVPKGCKHPSLRMRAFVLESGIGIMIAAGSLSVAGAVTR